MFVRAIHAACIGRQVFIVPYNQDFSGWCPVDGLWTQLELEIVIGGRTLCPLIRSFKKVFIRVV